MRLAIPILSAVVFLLAADAETRLSGLVKDPSGSLVPGAVVWAVTEDCFHSFPAIADQKGEYSFAGLPAGRYKVYTSQVSTSPEGLWHIGEKSVSIQLGEQQALDLYPAVSGSDTGGAKPTYPLHGIIKDAAGNGIEKASIFVSNSDFRRWEAKSRKDGSFGFCRVHGGKYQLRIEHPAYRPHTEQWHAAPAGKQREPISITLQPR
ncbi:MAG: carboxypeptidase regulatory-like domain-containing protein [Acidobacteria bacterium]|nr:carboxypeptidase regulatory-like domain-containing protein [Acidobacteriota bacterium]